MCNIAKFQIIFVCSLRRYTQYMAQHRRYIKYVISSKSKHLCSLPDFLPPVNARAHTFNRIYKYITVYTFSLIKYFLTTSIKFSRHVAGCLAALNKIISPPQQKMCFFFILENINSPLFSLLDMKSALSTTSVCCLCIKHIYQLFVFWYNVSLLKKYHECLFQSTTRIYRARLIV